MRKPKNTPKPAAPTLQQIRKAWHSPCSPGQMREIIASLRTLAAADFSLNRGEVRKLAAWVDESLGHVNGRFHYGQDTADLSIDACPRTLDHSELPLAAAMAAILDLLLGIHLGDTPVDCGPKLCTLADELEVRFNKLAADTGPGLDDGSKPTEAGPRARGHKPKKNPLRFLKEAQERTAAKWLAETESPTIRGLAKELEISASTADRLKAWRAYVELMPRKPKGGYRKRLKDGSFDVEAVSE